jgi:hypothetical protein
VAATQQRPAHIPLAGTIDEAALSDFRWDRHVSGGIMEDAAFLRAQAARCRRLAGMVTTPDVIETLQQMGRDYDERAEALEGVRSGTGEEPDG